MHEHDTLSAAETRHPSDDKDLQAKWARVVGRRSFLKGVGVAGAAALPGSMLLASEAAARPGRLAAGDVAILRFLAAAEIIESDLWQQYNELGGANGGNKPTSLPSPTLTATWRSTSPTTPTTSSAMQLFSTPT